MEQYAFKDLTLEIFRGVLAEEEFHAAPHAAIALQAYLTRRRERRSRVDSLGAPAKAAHRRAPGQGRLLGQRDRLGETEELADSGFPRQSGDRCQLRAAQPAVAGKSRRDRRRFRQPQLCAVWRTPSSPRRNSGLPANGYEIQMLYGMAEPVRQAIIQNGQRVRVYLPVGELLPGMSYLIRRLMENTSNTSFLRQTYADQKDIGEFDQGAGTAVDKATMTRGVIRDARRSSEPFSQRAADRFFAAGESRALRSKRSKKFAANSKAAVRKRSSGQWLESVNPADPEGSRRAVRVDQHRSKPRRRSKRRRDFFPKWRATPARNAPRFLLRRRRNHAPDNAGNSLRGKFSKSARDGAKRTPM